MHRLPTLFVSHGAPTFALLPGLAGPRLAALGRALTQALPPPPLPAKLDAEAAWQLGLALAPLADDGVLIVGSGSLTHNLHEIRAEGARMETYAAEFSAWVGDAATGSDRGRLKRTLVLAPHAQRAHPTPEHFWPLLVAAGAADPAQPGWIIEGGTTHGVLNMDSFVFGALPQQAR
ncbi:MAG: class III extradiol ring-cleavage dioxygenase [Burkholderiaceae bacterium]